LFDLRNAENRGRAMGTSLKITADETFFPPERILIRLVLISSSEILGRVRRERFPTGEVFADFALGAVVVESPSRPNMLSICLSSFAYFL